MDYGKLNKLFFKQFIDFNFTNNQRKILNFIWCYSWGLEKTYTIIPVVLCFELCGLTVNNVSKTLKELISHGVITRCLNIYTINPNFQEWTAERVFMPTTKREKLLSRMKSCKQIRKGD